MISGELRDKARTIQFSENGSDEDAGVAILSSLMELSPETLEAELCLLDFETFVKVFWDEVPGTEPLVWNWHMAVICEELQEVAEGVINNRPRKHHLIINISPGTSKSTLVSILFPAWLWARMPRCRILTGSHADELVRDLSGKARDVIKSERYQAYFPQVRIRADRDAQERYATEEGGERRTCTVSGKSPMGLHAHFQIIDDPIDPKKAVSEVELQNAKDFFDSVIMTRSVNKEVSVLILIMQRLHEEDPTGHMLKKAKREGADPVRWIKLPAELPKGEDGAWLESIVQPQELTRRYYEYNEDAKCYPDGLMDPVRLTRKQLKARQADGLYSYSGQFLQWPVPLGGGMFKRIYFNQRVKAAPYHCLRILYVDRASTAAEKNKDSCRTALVLLAMSPDKRFFVEWALAGQWEPYERNQILLSVAQKFRSRYGPRNEPAIWIEREGGASGVDAFQGIAAVLFGFNVREHNITGLGNKEARADPLSAQMAAGNFWVVDNGESLPGSESKSDWDIEEYIHEFELFPKGKWKDLVDATSGALAVLRDSDPGFGMRVFGTHERKSKDTQILLADKDSLVSILIEGPSILVSLKDHPKITDNGHAPNLEVPANACQDLLDSLVLQFADIQPLEHQESWDKPLSAYGKKAEQLTMNREHGKKLWAFLQRKRPRNWDTLVIQDDGGQDRRALSLALAVCEQWGRKPENTVFRLDAPDNKVQGVPPNAHVFHITKQGRMLVV